MHEESQFFDCEKSDDQPNYKIGIEKHTNLRHMVDSIEHKIAKIEAKENRDKVIKKFKRFSEDPENINLQEMWKVLKSIGPKFKKTVPMAKKNYKGKIISNPHELRKLLAQEYKLRLRSRPIRSDLGNLKLRRDEIFDLQLRLSEINKSQNWNMSDLDTALKCLKNNKSRDPSGFVNEIFKPGVIGTDMKNSMLQMFNILKAENVIPDFMKFSNITTIPKKGSLLELRNERGIFRVDILRSILMKLIYNQEYQEIDKNMSEGQMGGRKNKGSRNNIFIINGIIHDVLSSKNKKPIILQIYDYSQMFDSMNLKQAINDIYEAGLKNNNLSLLYKANNEIMMAVNTPSGLTERQKVSDIVLQGDTFSSLLASVQVDSISKDCSASGFGYNYKNKLSVGILGLMDDLVGVTEVGYKAKMMNVLINIKTAEKGLQFGAKKCKSMMIGKNSKNVLNSELSVDTWSIEHKENRETGNTELVETYTGPKEISNCTEQKYLGFVISSTGDNMANIKAIRNKSYGVIRKIFSKLNELNLQKYYFECGIIFLNVMLRSSILYASETYYNLKENQMRQLERIE